MQPVHKLPLFARVIALVVTLSHVAASAATRDDAALLAHGTESRIWAAHVAPKLEADPPRDITTILTRGSGDGQRWNTLAEIPARIMGITRRGGELVVLLEGGDWKLVSGTVIRSGERLPGGSPLLAIAGDDQTLWAIGAAAPAPATTGASTGPATRATQPAVGPEAESPATAPTRPLSVFRLDRGAWVQVAALPPPLRRAAAKDLSMTIVGHLPVLAGLSGEQILAFRLTASGEWAPRANIAAAEIRRFEVLSVDAQPALWLAGAEGAGAVRMLEGTSPAAELRTDRPIGRNRVAVSALGRLRLLYLDRDDRLHEQAFAADGSPVTEATEAMIERPATDRRIGEYIQLGVMVLLLLVMSRTIRGRQSLQEAIRKAGQLQLAPYGRRFLAGLIDAVPLLVLPVVYWMEDLSMSTSIDQAALNLLELWLWGAIIAYLLHTTTVEVLFGRSVGKMLLGLRPATLEGSRPAPGALLARNLLRIIDIVLLFPLVMILFSPLRQRVGDLAAGTLVVLDGSGPVPLEENKDAASTTAESQDET